MTNEEIILKSVQAHLTPAQRHEIAAAAYTTEQIAHAVEHIPDGLDTLAASQVHTFAWWKDNGKSVKRGEKALFTCPLWKYTDKPSKARLWNIVESRSGRAVARMMHSKAECADWLWKKFDPAVLAKCDLDAMEREKLAAPLEAAACI